MLSIINCELCDTKLSRVREASFKLQNISSLVQFRKKNKEMKKLEKNKKWLFYASILIISAAIIFVFFAIGASISHSSDSTESEFPSFIIFSSWPAIWIPLIVRKREEAKQKERLLLYKQE